MKAGILLPHLVESVTRDNVLYIAKEAEKEGCQHERVTKKVQLMEDRIRALLKDGPQPIVSHYIAKPVPK
jgi:hypothetical protein